MTSETCSKHGIFVLSYLLLIGIESYFIQSVKVLYSSYIFLGVLVALGLILNFVFLFIFGKSGKRVTPFSLYQIIQGVLAFLISFYLFHLPWKDSLAYPAGALLGLIAFVLITSAPSLRNILMVLLVGAGFTLALRLSSVSGGLLFALALLNSFYLGSALLSANASEKSNWENIVIFTAVLALGRAAIQYYLVSSGYDSLGVVITMPYTFIALFMGFLVPVAYVQIMKDKLAPCVLTFLALGIFLPWVLGIFIHVRPFSAYLLGFVVSSYIVGILLSAPLSLSLLTYLNLASGALGLSVFASLSNLGRGIRLAILGGVFLVTLLTYLIQSLLKKNKS